MCEDKKCLHAGIFFLLVQFAGSYGNPMGPTSGNGKSSKKNAMDAQGIQGCRRTKDKIEDIHYSAASLYIKTLKGHTSQISLCSECYPLRQPIEQGMVPALKHFDGNHTKHK
jgi:hypothetical protein